MGKELQEETGLLGLFEGYPEWLETDLLSPRLLVCNDLMDLLAVG